MTDDQQAWLRRRVHILLRATGDEYSQLGEFDEGLHGYEVASLPALRSQIDEALDTLTEREAHAMRLGFGLDDGRSRTLEAAGRAMGITAERVRQLEAAGLKKLREPTRRALLPRAIP